MLDYIQSKNHLGTAKQIIRDNSACDLKIRQFFSQREPTDRVDLPPPVRFSLLFKDPLPLHNKHTF